MELILDMEIIILVEGHTEKRFCDGVLKPYLEVKKFFLKAVLIDTKSTPTGPNQKGGITNYEKQVRLELKRHLNNNNPNLGLISTMFDLYRLPKDFPMYEKSRNTRDPYERVRFLEESLKSSLENDGMNINKFIPYLQLHEFEAFMFVDSAKTLEKLMNTDQEQKKRYEKIIRQYENPELINSDKGPSVHMKEIFSESFQKSTIGFSIAESIGLNTLRTKCRHFHEWLEKLERISG